MPNSGTFIINKIFIQIKKIQEHSKCNVINKEDVNNLIIIIQKQNNQNTILFLKKNFKNFKIIYYAEEIRMREKRCNVYF